MNDWKQLKQKHPNQINAVTVIDDKGNQGTFMHVRTALFNYLTRSNSMETPEMDDYRKKQHNASIDTLTNQLKQMETDIATQETAWQDKVNHRDITKDVLRLKLEDTLKSLHYEDAPEKTDLINGIYELKENAT